MTITELENTLRNLKAGQAATLNYEMFELVFPPGVEDDRMKEVVYQFAKSNGCVIDHRPDRREVNFVKP